MLNEIARHPELRDAVAVLMPNLKSAAAIMAHHQAAGRLAEGDPLFKVILLIAPVMSMGLWRRTGLNLPLAEADTDAATVVRAFLDGNRRRDV